jgi:hypothetical protein
MLSEAIGRNADDHAVEAPLPSRHCGNASRHSPRGAAVSPAQPLWGGHSCPPPLIFSVDSVFSVVNAFEIRVNPRKSAAKAFDRYLGTASAVPKLHPLVILSEVIVRNADDHAVEGPLPSRHYLTASRHSPANAAVRPAQPVWDGHSCPPLLTFSVTLCLCGEWF